MSNKGEKSMDKSLSVSVCAAFAQLIQNIENEPGLILEGESQPVDGENTLKEIRAWLFVRRRADGHRDNTPDR